MSYREKVCVVGSGIVGLASALLLSDAGYKVTVAAQNLPGDQTTDWSSPWAGALLAPYPGGSPDMQKESLQYYVTLMKDPSTGIKTLPITEYYNDRDDGRTIWYKSLYPDFRFLPKSELPPHAKIGYSYTGLAVSPTLFLPWLQTELERRGVSFVRTTLTSFEEAQTLTGADMIVNASGLGAKLLANDPAVLSIRGQTMFCPCDFDQCYQFQGSEYTYVIPRPQSGGVILGGISQKGSTDTKVDNNLKRDILARVNKITNNAFAWVDVEKDVQDIVGFRPSREGGLRVEREGNVIHAYGAGGLGYLYAFGIAQGVKKLAKSLAKI